MTPRDGPAASFVVGAVASGGLPSLFLVRQHVKPALCDHAQTSDDAMFSIRDPRGPDQVSFSSQIRF